MVAPTGFDAYVTDEATKKFIFLKGWALVAGEDVIIVTESTNATAIVDYVDPVIVYWTDASGENILDTDYYFPGEKTVLDAYNGVNIDVDHTPDYYSYGRQGWAGIEEATAGLATPGEYYITAIMGKIAPDTFPGLKYSLSLYSNFVMNFYVPTDIEGVSNLVISTNADGSSLISEFAPEAIDGVTYDKYGYMLGVADTEIKTFYIVYNVGDDRLSFPVSVGVPTYAASVMEEYSEDNSSAGVALKTLVVNMANYAVKVLELNGSDMNSDGAKIYNEIINANADYLSYYNSLTNEKFLADGEFYNKHGVASLNYVSRDDESNSEALSYIKSIGFNFNTFEPAFIIKFSDAALAEGLQAPTANGSTEYFKAGLRVYAGTSPQFAAKVWAEKDGNKYYGLADIWASVNADGVYDNNCSSEYEYFAMAVGSDDNASIEWYKDNNVREDLKIKIYMSENDSTAEIVGEVNYNLAAYINAMLKDAEGNADYIEAAKAIYAYSYVSEYYGLVK